jgi:hypothetical protein
MINVHLCHHLKIMIGFPWSNRDGKDKFADSLPLIRYFDRVAAIGAVHVKFVSEISAAPHVNRNRDWSDR